MGGGGGRLGAPPLLSLGKRRCDSPSDGIMVPRAVGCGGVVCVGGEVRVCVGEILTDKSQHVMQYTMVTVVF